MSNGLGGSSRSGSFDRSLWKTDISRQVLAVAKSRRGVA